MDHLIALSLGGSNSKKNLWPESYLTEPWNAHTKDQLEYRLLTLVRAGKVDLKTAQQEMASDCIAAYKKYVSPIPLSSKGKGRKRTGKGVGDTSVLKDEDPETESSPPATPSSTTSPNVATDDGKVWVNTKSGVIWQPGSRYYGKTKEGQYMSAAEAIKAGYHYAK